MGLGLYDESDDPQELPFEAEVKSRFRTVEERLSLNKRSIEQRKVKLAAAFPLFGSEITLVAGLNIIGAMTGAGKTTATACIISEFIKEHPDKEVLFISNEEQTSDFWARIACIFLEYDFELYYNDQMDPIDVKEVQRVVEEYVIPRVQVVGPEDGTSKLENVVSVFKDSRKYGLVVFDYYQNVVSSDENIETWRLLKKLGSFLKDHAKSVLSPVVLFVQMSAGEDHYTRRVQLDKNVANHAHLFVELESKKKESKAILKVRKARFQRIEQKWCSLDFKTGWFERPTKLQYADEWEGA